MLSLVVRKFTDRLHRLKLASKVVPCYGPFAVNTLSGVRNYYLGGVDIWCRDHKSFVQPCQAPTADVSKLLFVSLGENRFNL